MIYELTAEQCTFAAQAWLSHMRSTWARKNPGKECPVIAWADLTEECQFGLMLSMRAAMKAADPTFIREAKRRKEAAT